MTAFLLDLWHDLVRTRMVFVAGLLLAVLIAAPILLLEPTQTTGEKPPPVAPVGATPAKGTLGGGKTRAFKLAAAPGKNPFRPLASIASGSSDAGDSAGSRDGSSGAGPLPSGGGAGTGSSAGPGKSADGAPALVPAGGGDSSGATTYAYAVDLRFGERSAPRDVYVERLDLIPTRRQPLLIYLGVTPSLKTAVFMVDSRLSHAGEGTCSPSPDVCTFLALRADKEHDRHFLRDPDGTVYTVQLLRIVRVPASTSQRTVVSEGTRQLDPASVIDESR